MSDEAAECSYSSDALNTLARFHRVKFVVYVEGPDDVAFWASLFDKSGISEYYVDYAGGIQELEKIMAQIIQDDAQVIAACDAHYSLLLGTLPNHDRIISTFGHSIENTMYCPHIINRVIRKLSRNLNDYINSITACYTAFCASATLFLIYDLAREKYDKSVQVCPDNCSRFLKSHYSYHLDDTKIRDYIAQRKSDFCDAEIKASEILIGQSTIEIRYIIKGHFITNAIINFIKASVKNFTGKRPVIPVNLLYALTSDGCMPCEGQCHEFITYRDKITKALQSLIPIS